MAVAMSGGFHRIHVTVLLVAMLTFVFKLKSHVSYAVRL